MELILGNLIIALANRSVLYFESVHNTAILISLHRNGAAAHSLHQKHE
jgi:hypothetical protein